jgi:NitT/TauT family transport system substrate-binding protein
MTRTHAAALAAVCVVWLAACGQEPLPPLRVGTFPGPTSELVFLAQHRGWLPPPDFRLVEFVNDGEVMRAFRNGSIEAAFVSLDEVLALAQSGMDPVILFVAAESRGGDAIVAHPDVTSLADLRGRRVAVQVNSVSTYLLRRSLSAAGLAASDLQVVNLPPDRHRAAFLRRDVDAVVTAEPVRTEIVGLGGIELFSSASLPLELVGVTIISGPYLEQHGERVSALCSAWRRAEAEVATSAGARDWIAAHMRVTPGALGAMLGVVRLVKPSESDALLGPPRPRLMSTAARIQSVLLESGLLSKPLSLDPIFRWPVGVDQAVCRS